MIAWAAVGGEPFFEMVAHNAVVAGVLALAAEVMRRKGASSALVHCMWVLVLLKLVTPPMFRLEIEVPAMVHAVAVDHAATPRPVESPRIGSPRIGPPTADRMLPPLWEDGARSDPSHLDSSPADRMSGPTFDSRWRASVESVRPRFDPDRLDGTLVLPPDGQPDAFALGGPEHVGGSPHPAATWRAAEPWSITEACAGLWTSFATWAGDVGWWTLGAWVWGVVGVLLAGWVLVGTLRFGAVVRMAGPAPEPVLRRVRVIAERLGLRTVPEVRLVPARISPMIWCFLGRPKLLLPTDLLKRLDPDVTDTLIAHELAHVKRGDHIIRHFELLVRGLHWWNPLVWWACHRLRAAEEECCDAWVLWALPDGRRCYAEAIVGTVEFLNESDPETMPAAACGMGRVDDLRRRITMIMQGKARRVLSRPAKIATAAFAATFLMWMPAIAQQQPDQPVKPDAPAKPTTRASLLSEVLADKELAQNLQHDMADITARIEDAKAALEAARRAHPSADVRGALAELGSADADIARANADLFAARKLAENPFGAVHAAAADRGEQVVVTLPKSAKELFRTLRTAAKLLDDAGDEAGADDLRKLGAALRKGKPAKAAHADIDRLHRDLAVRADQLEAERHHLQQRHADFERMSEDLRARFEVRSQEQANEIQKRAEAMQRELEQRRAELQDRASAFEARVQEQAADAARRAHDLSSRGVRGRIVRDPVTGHHPRAERSSGDDRMERLESRVEEKSRMLEQLLHQQMREKSRSSDRADEGDSPARGRRAR